MTKRRLICALLIMSAFMCACSERSHRVENQTMEDAGEEQNTVVAPSEVAEEAKSNEEGEQKVTAPSREEVLAMRQRVLEGMTEEDIRQLTL